MPLNPLAAGAATPAQLPAEYELENPNVSAPAKLEYDKEIHGDAKAFRDSAQFPVFKDQYEAELDVLANFADELFSADDAHRLKSQIKTYKEHLFDNDDFFSNKSEVMFKIARDQIAGIIQLLQTESIPELDKVTTVERTLGEMDKCAYGVLDNLQTAYQHLELCRDGAKGKFKLALLQKIESEAQQFAQQEHNGQENYVGNEIHYVNAYKNYAINVLFPDLPVSEDSLAAECGAKAGPERLDGFYHKVAVSVTPGSVTEELCKTLKQSLYSALDKHGLLYDKEFNFLEKMNPDLNNALNEIVTTLKPFVAFSQQGDFTFGDLMSKPDNFDYIDGDVSFKEAGQTIQQILVASAKDGLVSWAWPRVAEMSEKLTDLSDGSSVHQKHGIEFFVAIPDSTDSRALKLKDLSSLSLFHWPLSLVKDLAQQAIKEATSVDELINFASKLKESPPQPYPALSSDLQSKLKQTMQEQVSESPKLQESVVERIASADSAEDLEPLEGLVGMSTKLKVALLIKISNSTIPLPEELRNALSDLDVISKLPTKLLEKTFDKTQIFGLLIRASKVSNAEAVKALILVDGTNVNQSNENGDTPLTIAGSNGHSEVVKALIIVEGIDVNKPNGNGYTPLMLASINGHADVVTALLGSHELTVNLSNSGGYTPLTIAVTYGHADVVKALLNVEGIVDVNKADDNGYTPLTIAGFNGKSEIVNAEVTKTLLRATHIEVNKPNRHGFTPLMVACAANQAKVVTELVGVKGIEVNEPNENGYTPLLAACKSGLVELVKALVNAEDIQVNELDENGYTPLTIAGENGNAEMVKALLGANHINVNQSDGNGFTPLTIAGMTGQTEMVHAEVVKALLGANGIEVNQPDGNGNTSLIIACMNGHAEVVKELLSVQGIDVNQPDSDGDTPLAIATNLDSTEVMNALLGAQDNDDDTSLK